MTIKKVPHLLFLFCYGSVCQWTRFFCVKLKVFKQLMLVSHVLLFAFSDWIEWQPDEKRRIRILDLIESVRKSTLRKSTSSPATANQVATVGSGGRRSPKFSATSLSANEETGRALRLHHSRQQSHSLRNLSSPSSNLPHAHGSHKQHHEYDAKIHPDHTFTR